jgi:hypothetical protein
MQVRQWVSYFIFTQKFSKLGRATWNEPMGHMLDSMTQGAERNIYYTYIIEAQSNRNFYCI